MVGLDLNRKEPAYLLGRLFSKLVDVQYLANPAINATIKDRYLDAAATSPAKVFPMLLSLSEAHTKKVRRQNPGAAYRFDEFKRTIIDELSTFPKSLSPQEQGDFYIGFYHQTSYDIQQRQAAKQHRNEKENQ